MRRLLLATFIAFLAMVPAAQAARVTYAEAPDKLRIYDDGNDVNDLRVTQNGLTFTVSDSQPLTEDSVRCTSDLGAGVVTCSVPPETKEVQVYAGGGDDKVTLSTTMASTVYGEGGGDALVGGAGPDNLQGDLEPPNAFGVTERTDVGTPGGDTLTGNGGTDSFVAGAGDDVLKTEDDKVAESVDCGEGLDSGNADAEDTLTACESVVQPAPVPGPTVQPESNDDVKGDPPSGPKVAVPVPGKSVAVAVKQGVIMVRRPGTSKAVPLDPTQPVPVGSVLDATKGTLTLTAANGGARVAQAGAAKTQTADFTGASFVVGQKAGAPGTELRMVGGDFSVCGRASGSRTTARAAASRKRVRRLWGSGHGRFTTRGKNSSATVRGTIWIVEDRCDGTLTRVERGVVVVTDHVRGRTKVVRAGQSYLVRNPPARKRR